MEQVATFNWGTYINMTSFIFILIGVLGMFSHGLKKYLKNELSGSVYRYFFVTNKKQTALAVLTCLGSLAAIVFGDQMPTDKLGAFVLTAFSTGYMADSAINKDEG